MDTIMHTVRSGVSVDFKGIVSAWISNARNQALDHFHHDFLMFIDSDMVFPHDSILKLMSHNKDIVGGMYYKKGDMNRPVVTRFGAQEGKYIPLEKVPDKLFRVDALGTGFMLISKRVLDAFTPEVCRKLGKPFNFLTLPDTDGLEESEDWAFCRRAAKLGFESWCDPTIPLGHIGREIYKREHFEAGRQYLEYLKKSVEYTNDIPGWMSPLELDWLYKTAKKMSSIIEIGSWKGRSTHALLSGCKGPVIAVDHFKGSIGEEKEHQEAKDHDIYEEFIKNVGSFKNLKVMRTDSLKAACLFEDKSVDMVFIDGGHRYEEVKRDIEAWLPKTRRIICGHDYNWNSVKQAVEEKFGFVDTAETIWLKWLK